MKGWQKNYAPYEGNEPYLYLAFAQTDAQKVWPVMQVLLKRGCRVWYCTGPAGNSQELLRRQERAKGAAWTLLYLSDALAADQESKSRIMVNQMDRKVITCLNTDETNRYLAMDIRESTPGIPLHRCRKETELEDALIQAEGYTQDILGKPVQIKNPWIGKLTGIFALLTVVLVGCCVFFLNREPAYQDTVAFSDPVIREAVRNAAGGGALDAESLPSVERIFFVALPESWEDLSLLPNLKEIKVSQEAAAQTDQLPVDAYRIVLDGGVS